LVLFETVFLEICLSNFLEEYFEEILNDCDEEGIAIINILFQSSGFADNNYFHLNVEGTLLDD